MNEPIDDTPQPVPFAETWHPDQRVEVPVYLTCPDCYHRLIPVYVLRDRAGTWLLRCELEQTTFEYRWVE